MEKIIVVVFDDELKAIEGFRILKELDREGEISIYEAEIISKGSSGAVGLVEDADMLSLPLIGGGTLVGALVGLLGGPVGAIVGATAGGLIGSIGDAIEAGFTDEFVDDIATALAPDKVAVVADISEEWVTPLDQRMEDLGGVVFRRPLTTVKATQEDRDAAAHKAEMERLKLEEAEVRSDQAANIAAKIDHLRVKLERAIERKRSKMQLRRQQRDAKIQALQTKADQAEGETRRRQEDRIAELQRDYEEKEAAG